MQTIDTYQIDYITGIRVGDTLVDNKIMKATIKAFSTKQMWRKLKRRNTNASSISVLGCKINGVKQLNRSILV